jgi:glucose 1-dehydrogenase
MTSKRSVVVTGAESGIGAACALAFGEIGDDVAILYFKDADAAARSVDAVARAGGRARAIQCDVQDEASVDRAFTEAEAAFGQVSVAVNSAGLNMSGVKVRDMSAAQWHRLIATDLTGAFNVSRRFVRGRGASKDPASLIHISSIHAQVVRAGGADYCAAKGGLANLVETLAIEEAANNVRVNAIRPGMILTPMNEHAVEDLDYRHKLEANIPMRRAGRPEEIAVVARWLASAEASYVTGAAITVDGGLSLLLGVGA